MLQDDGQNCMTERHWRELSRRAARPQDFGVSPEGTYVCSSDSTLMLIGRSGARSRTVLACPCGASRVIFGLGKTENGRGYLRQSD